MDPQTRGLQDGEMRRVSLVAGAVSSSLLALTIVAHAGGGPELPPGQDRALVYGQCRTCHDLQYLVESAGIPRDAWSDILDSMKQYGLQLAPDRRSRILDYLSTYLGPHPPPASAASAAPRRNEADGAAIFKEQCATCHQEDGKGVAGQFPPLAGNRDLFLSADYPARVVLSGLKGTIVVNGQEFDAEMPPFNLLSDRQIAAVVIYVRKSLGNRVLRPEQMSEIDGATVEKLRGHQVTADDVHALRKRLKAAATR